MEGFIKKLQTYLFQLALIFIYYHADNDESTATHTRTFPKKTCVFFEKHRRCSVNKDVLKNFTKFTRKHLCRSLFTYNVAGLSPATLIKESLRHRCIKNHFFTEYLRATASVHLTHPSLVKNLSIEEQLLIGFLKNNSFSRKL